MPYFILGIAFIVGMIFVVRGLRGAQPQTVARVFKWLAIGAATTVIVILTLRGGLLTGILVALGMIPVILRWRALSKMARGWRGPQAGQTSDVETRYLRMTLDHDTGTLDGTILDGEFKGRMLHELDAEQLMRLMQECRVNDRQSAQILESYLDRVHGTDWRAAGAGNGEQSHGGEASSGVMTREEAYNILGLKPGATPDQIKDAHRQLMLKMHPDHGGSNYLAAKINQAKDLLLGN